MSWYNGSFKRRQQITLDGSASTSGVYDLVITIPVDFDNFWNNIRSDGNDIVVTFADGTSLTGFQFRAGHSISDRNLRLQVQNYTLPVSNVIGFAWLYWDNPDQNTSLQTTHTPATNTIIGNIYTCSPYGRLVTSIAYGGAGFQPEETFSKEPTEKIDIWFPISSVLSPRLQPFNQHLQCEEIAYVTGFVLNSSGGLETTMIAEEETRATSGWGMLRIISGTTGNNYIVKILIHTTNAQDITLCALLEVKTILP